ncbi:MAG: hypothetical protein M1378_10660 [Bacteroidetes bacterium]|nr:hypothetical protein [Bacteroidota bacterium]
MIKAKKNLLDLLLLIAIFGCLLYAGNSFAQEPPIGAQNGVTWKGLNVGTQAETVTRKTFYVDGLYNMSVFWSQHQGMNESAVDYNAAFMGMDVAQIRDGLDSFYVNPKNVFVPIVDAVLVVRLQNAQIGQARIDQVVREFRAATINGVDPEQENKIWKATLPLLR